MTDEPFLRIGPFSTASSLSVKALRAYHESGLLLPAVVDPSTGPHDTDDPDAYRTELCWPLRGES